MKLSQWPKVSKFSWQPSISVWFRFRVQCFSSCAFVIREWWWMFIYIHHPVGPSRITSDLWRVLSEVKCKPHLSTFQLVKPDHLDPTCQVKQQWAHGAEMGVHLTLHIALHWLLVVLEDRASVRDIYIYMYMNSYVYLVKYSWWWGRNVSEVLNFDSKLIQLVTQENQVCDMYMNMQFWNIRVAEGEAVTSPNKLVHNALKFTYVIF